MSGKDKIREQLSAYLDGELSEGESRLVDEMVASDPALSAELESLRLVQSLLRGLPPTQAPAGMADAVLARTHRRHTGWRMGHLAQAAIVLLAVGVGVTVTAWLNRPTHPRQTERQTPYSSKTPVLAEGKIADVGGLVTAETTNVFINTDNLLLTQREVEHVFGKNSIKPIVEIAGAPKAAAEPRGRANFYNQTQVTPNQVRYEVAITDNQMRQIVSELNEIRARQNVAQSPAGGGFIKDGDTLVLAEADVRSGSAGERADRDAVYKKGEDSKKQFGDMARLERSAEGHRVADQATGKAKEVASQPALAFVAKPPAASTTTTMSASTVVAQQSLPDEAGDVHEQEAVRRQATTTTATANVRQLVVILNVVGGE